MILTISPPQTDPVFHGILRLHTSVDHQAGSCCRLFSESASSIINAVLAFVKESPLRGRGVKSAVRKLRTADFHMYSAAPFSGWKQYCIVASLWWRFTRWEIISMSTYTGKATTLIIPADRTKRMIPSTVSGFRWSRSVVRAAGFQTVADQPERRCTA